MKYILRNIFILHRIADKHVFWVLQGKSEDEIYIHEKLKSDTATQLPKVSGYIAPDEYEQRKNDIMRRSNSNLFLSESSMDSFSMLSQQSNTSMNALHSKSNEYINQLSQTSCFGVSQQRLNSSQMSTYHNNTSTHKINITNSSSKSNSKSSVLRENVDSDQRQKSAQKVFGFSGKDQKNVSPYNDKVRQNSLNKHKTLISGGNNIMNANILKAKRQISFDS